MRYHAAYTKKVTKFATQNLSDFRKFWTRGKDTSTEMHFFHSKCFANRKKTKPKTKFCIGVEKTFLKNLKIKFKQMLRSKN